MSHFSPSDAGAHHVTCGGCVPQTLCQGAGPNTRYYHTGVPVRRLKATIDFQ